MKVNKNKIIRDAVHGNIIVEKEFVNTILDTTYFQRLRRIEQTSIRSVYPSARHDRFIHSLGVYYIGSKIANHILEEWDVANQDLTKQNLQDISVSYKVACLLHDIAHAPFSHTFEEYYGNSYDLYEVLNSLIGGPLKLTPIQQKDINPHEYASAILVAREDGLKCNVERIQGTNIELICRMIIGAHYDSETAYNQVANCFISLLHGEIFDADRVDYACRDVWASGYRTATLDVDRLVAAIHLRKSIEANQYCVCVDHNAITELQNMLEIRQFQNKYVINHHTVQYEQKLLILAAEAMAKNLYPKYSGHTALGKVITLNSVVSKEIVKGIEFKHFCDDDLFYLIKHDTKPNSYFEELESRQYKRFALWKSVGEFYKYFPNVSKQKAVTCASFEDRIKYKLRTIIPNTKEIVVCPVAFKADLDLSKLNISFSGDTKTYAFESVKPNYFSSLNNSIETKKVYFNFVYVPYPEDDVDVEAYRKQIINQLTPFFERILPDIVESPKKKKRRDYYNAKIIKNKINTQQKRKQPKQK